jgi:glyoxylase-like metal-dependent hydrolase (beta-lactamase superfamily II)
MKFAIYPIDLGRLHGVDKSRLTYLANAGTTVSIPLIMWVLKNGDDAVVFDSGPDPPDVVRNMFGRDLDQKPGGDLLSALARINVTPERVRTLVLSHLHWDHCGNLERFPNARILVQRSELAYANCPAPCFCHTYAAPIGGHQPTWHRSGSRIVAVDGSFQLTPGIDVIALPGHTPGMQGLAVATADGTYVLASDTFNLYENYDAAVPPTIHADVDDWYRSYELIRRIADRVLPSHDLSVLEQPRYGDRGDEHGTGLEGGGLMLERR